MKSKNKIERLHTISGYTITEKIFEQTPYVIYRGLREGDGLEVVIKTFSDTYPKKEDILGLKREYRITKSLSFKGIIEHYDIIEHSHTNMAIVMESFGISLQDYLQKLNANRCSLDDFFWIAIKLVETCGYLQKRRIIHKKLNPFNILIDPNSKEIRIIDLSDSSELSQETIQHVPFSHWDNNTIMYISPEQTGRINRGIDYRSDFYSLGMCFYQMLTGVLPFKADDAIGWVHATISRTPIPLNELNPNIPPVISELVLKLLSKNAEHRYQSGHGLLYDLKTCRELIKTGDPHFQLHLGKEDLSQEFQIPQKLYGREREMELLETLFENVSLGSVEFCLVSGYSGIGKTALVSELGRYIVKKNGYLIQGKFEQFKQNAPFSTIADAFGDLLEQLFGEPVERFKVWQENLRSALGEDAQLLTDLIHRLETIIGPQETIPILSPDEFQKRFYKVFISFVKVFTKKDHPLVLFMDDLQWSDVPTLNLIRELVTSSDLEHFFIIGAYRNKEVDATHPLSLVLREIQSKRFLEDIELKPLEPHAFYALLRESLFCSPNEAEALGLELYNKTGGNPFFFIQLLKNLKESNAISFDMESGRWYWDISAIQNQNFSDNVIDILIENQNRLSPAAQEIVQLAASIGNTFDLKTVSVLSKKTIETVGLDLFEALRLDMILPLKEQYKFIGGGEYPDNEFMQNLLNNLNPTYKFQHDRIQQAAYSQIPTLKKQQLHLEIGKLLLEQSSKEELEEKIISIVNHLNEGIPFFTEQEHKTYAELNFKAAHKAKQSSAYATALEYLIIAQRLLGSLQWELHYSLAWEIHNELQYCLYLTGDWRGADEVSDILLKKSKEPIEKGLVLSSRTRQYATTQRMRESILAAYEGLAILGFNLEEKPSERHIQEELELIDGQLHGRSIKSLVDLPLITDKKAKIANQLLMEIFPAAFLSGTGEMFPYLVLKSVNIALSYGNSSETAFAYAAFGMLLCGYLEDTAKGYEYGKLGVELNQKLGDEPLRARIVYVYTMFVHHWSNHWTSMTPWFKKGIEAGYQSGDLLYLAYSAQDCIIWDPQIDLEAASKEHKKLLEIVEECEYKDSLDSGTLFLQMQLNFQGSTSDKFSMTNADFDEEVCVKGMKERRFMTGLSNYAIYKAEIHLLYNDSRGALPYVLEQEERTASVMALPQMVRFQVVSFLVYAMVLPGCSSEERTLYFSRMKQSQKRMASWAKQCAENFEHLDLFMKAEIARVLNKNEMALSLYEMAISAARKSGFLHDEAMCNERAGNMLLEHTFGKAAEGYLREAHYLYYRWAAYRKVEDLEENYPSIHFPGTYAFKNNQLSVAMESSQIQSEPLQAQSLDILSVLKASQAISGELALDKLLESTLKVLIENAGANIGMIVDLIEDQIIVRARISLDDHSFNMDGSNANVEFPKTLIHTAFRRNEAIVIDNASELNSFSSDAYFKKKKTLSVICVPLTLHGKRTSAIYMENNLIHSAFTKERVKVIEMLSTQATISMENAKIYEQQKSLLSAQQRFVPSQFLKHLGHRDITKVTLGESVTMDMSVLFTDILDFTPLVERRAPQEVIQFLNRLFNKMGGVIKEWNGFVDSYAGDQIMALFSMPVHQSIHGAIKMFEALREFNKESETYDFPPVEMGIGINTGSLVLGTMGAVDRMQCSVLGDTVNLASRIEQLTRKYGVKILIGEQTYEALENRELFSIRMVDYVAVKGKGIAIKLYEIMDAESEERKQAKFKTQPLLKKGLEYYFSRDFTQAIDQFREAIIIDQKDPVLRLFLDRAQNYILNPPPQDWAGFEKLQQK